jgi:hypothetical protein
MSVPSGPNSVFNQSDVREAPFPLPPKRAVLAVPANTIRLSSQCSTNERAERETFAHEHDVDPSHPAEAVIRKSRCSLERR